MSMINVKKRTHYSDEITPDMDGKKVSLVGWVHEIRDLGGIVFLLLRDREGIIQVTAPSKKVDKELMDKMRKSGKESVIFVEGTVKESSKAPNNVEIIPTNFEIINKSKQPLPLDTTGKVKAELDTRLDARFLDLRKLNVNAIFKIRNKMLNSVRKFFEENGFIEINTPKLVASATEGGTALFPVTYFEREAFLGQSPQLYKQMMMAAGFEKVYEIGPIFRAEEHDTLRHLNEAISIDIEVSFANHEDVMKILENLIVRVIEDLNKSCKKELKILNKKLEVPETPFERITYDEVIEIVNSKGVVLEYGEDLSRAAEKALGEEMDNYYFIIDWPTSIKPFYVMPNEKNPEKCYAFDLMYKDLEISSGAMRIHDHDLLVKRIKEQDLNPESFKYYLDAFKYGMPPHAGWGLGAERFMMALTGVKIYVKLFCFQEIEED